MKEFEDKVSHISKLFIQFETLINQMRKGSLQSTDRELSIDNFTFKFTFGTGHGIIGVYKETKFLTNIQVELDFIKVTSTVLEGKVTTYNLRKDNPILGVVINDILSEYFPKFI